MEEKLSTFKNETIFFEYFIIGKMKLFCGQGSTNVLSWIPNYYKVGLSCFFLMFLRVCEEVGFLLPTSSLATSASLGLKCRDRSNASTMLVVITI